MGQRRADACLEVCDTGCGMDESTVTGFNPTDMYAADHVRRVLETFPGVFSGIGEFTIHKEFVSAKVAGGVASLQDPALDRLLDYAAAVGLVALVHNDMDTPFPKPGAKPAYLEQMTALLKRHPNATIIWAHTGVGRVVRPIQDYAANLEKLLQDPELPNLYFDISWDEVAKYVVASPEATKTTATMKRDHTFEHAESVNRIALEWYRRCGYQVLEVPMVSVDERCTFVVQALAL
jgi:hypothetical protein